MFSFWIHTSFIKEQVLTLTKSECDGAVKDKYNKHFEPTFRVELYLTDQVGCLVAWLLGCLVAWLLGRSFELLKPFASRYITMPKLMKPMGPKMLRMWKRRTKRMIEKRCNCASIVQLVPFNLSQLSSTPQSNTCFNKSCCTRIESYKTFEFFPQ